MATAIFTLSPAWPEERLFCIDPTSAGNDCLMGIFTLVFEEEGTPAKIKILFPDSNKDSNKFFDTIKKDISPSLNKSNDANWLIRKQDIKAQCKSRSKVCFKENGQMVYIFRSSVVQNICLYIKCVLHDMPENNTVTIYCYNAALLVEKGYWDGIDNDDPDTIKYRRTLRIQQAAADIGACLRRIRKNKHLSMAKLGDECGLDRRTIHYVETKFCSSDFETVLAVLDALDLQDDFFSFFIKQTQNKVVKDGRDEVSRSDYTAAFIGQNLQAIRKGNDTSQAELAIQSGLRQAQISRIENNWSSYRLSSMMAILDAFGLLDKFVKVFKRRSGKQKRNKNRSRKLSTKTMADST